MKKNSNALAIEAIRKQIQVIAFDANLYDLGIITDNPYQQQCSARRKKLNAELVKLGATPKPLPFLTVDEPIQKVDEKQLEMFL